MLPTEALEYFKPSLMEECGQSSENQNADKKDKQ